MGSVASLIRGFSARADKYRDEEAQARREQERGLTSTLATLIGSEDVHPRVRQQALAAMFDVTAGRGKLTPKGIAGYFGQTETAPHVQGLMDLLGRMGAGGRVAGRAGEPTAEPTAGPPQSPEREDDARVSAGTPAVGAPLPTLPGAAPDPNGLWLDPVQQMQDQVVAEYETLRTILQRAGANPDEEKRVIAGKMGGSLPAAPIEEYTPAYGEGGKMVGSFSNRRPGVYGMAGQPLPDAVAISPQQIAAEARPGPRDESRVADPNSPTGYSWVRVDPYTGEELSRTLGAPPQAVPPYYGGPSFVNTEGQVVGSTREGGQTVLGTSASAITPAMRNADRALKAFAAAQKNPLTGVRMNNPAFRQQVWAQILTEAGYPPTMTQAQLTQIAAGVLDETLQPRGAGATSQAGAAPPASTPSPLNGNVEEVKRRMLQNRQTPPAR